MNTKLFLLCLIFIGHVYAQSSSSSSSSVSSVNSSNSSLSASSASSSEFALKDSDDYQVGDNIIFPVNIYAKKLDENLTESSVLCIPMKTKLRVLNIDEDKSYMIVKAGESLYKKLLGKQLLDCSSANNLKGNAIKITAEQVELLAPGRTGFKYGLLTVPYKYHSHGSKSFDGGATIAPYLGYGSDKYDDAYGLKIIFFAGLSKVSVTQNVDGETTTQSLSAFSYGGGLLGEVNKKVQVGLVVGKDRVDSGAKFDDDNKTWVSIAIAFPFSN